MGESMNCEKVTFLIEKRALAKLSKWERFQIKFHQGICRNCKKYEEDSSVLNKLLNKMSKMTKPTKVLDKLEKENLKDVLRKESAQ